MAILGMSEFSIQTRRDDDIDEIINEIYNPSSGIITQLKKTKAEVDILSDSVAIKANRDELITSKNEKFKVRYIRDYLNGSNATSENRWVEVQAFSGSENVLSGLIPSSNHTLTDDSICTDGDTSNSRYTVTKGAGTAYIQFDLLTIRDDIDFIHIWHYYGENVIYDGTKTSISEDGINWVNLFDSKNNNSTGRYRESSRGSIIFVNQGAIIESVTKRIAAAEILVKPDSITQTVRENMGKEFTSSINLLSQRSRFKNDTWNGRGFLFDDNYYFAMLNAKENESGSIDCSPSIRLDKDSYYTFSFNVFQESVLDTARFNMTITISGTNLLESKEFSNFGLNQISSKQPKNFFFTIKTGGSEDIRVSSVKIDISRRSVINTTATVVFLEPQFETGAFPTAYSYPSLLDVQEFYSYKEQTANLITQKVSSVENAFNNQGYSNYIKNGSFDRKLEFWSTHNCFDFKVGNDLAYPCDGNTLEVTTKDVGGVFQRIKGLEIGSEYTCSLSLFTDPENPVIVDAFIEDAKENGVECYNTDNYNKFDVFKFTFTAEKVEHTLVIYSKGEGRFFVDNVMMTKGTKYVPFEPSTSELNENFSELKQDNESFKFNIVKSGQNNLLKNSEFSIFEEFVNEWGQRDINIPNWKKYGYQLEPGMNIIAMDVIGYSGAWGYRSKTENTLQISDKNSYATQHDNSEMSAYTRVQTIANKRYTLSFLCAGHRINKAYASIRDSEDSEYVYERVIIDDVPTGGEDTGNWKYVTLSFVARSVNTRIEIGLCGKTYENPYFWLVRPMLNTGSIALDYTSSNKELVSGITTIDEDGVKIEMADGDGAKGYTRINYEGLSTYDKNNNRKAWFGEDDSAYIKKLRCDSISNRYIIKWAEDRPAYVYVAPNATGDGTGRDVNNKSNSVNHALNWIWNNYGCYSWQRNLYIEVDAGTYTEDIYIGGWIGSGEIYLNIDGQATIYGSHRIEENTMAVTIQGRMDYDTWSDWGAWFKFRRGTFDNDELFHIRRSNVLIRGCRAVKEGYSSEYNNWNGYTNKFIRAGEGSQVYVYNCVAVGFYYFGYAIYSSILSMHKNRGHCDTAMYLHRGSIGMLSDHYPINRAKRDWREGCIYDENTIGTEHNDNTYPKQEQTTPPPPPPPPPPSYIWVENTFNAYNLRTYTEGPGSATTNRTGMWGQGSWGGYKSHRGYADLGDGPSNWCSGGRNFTVWITLKRISSGGYNGEVPVPKIKEPNGSFWSCGVAFAHNQTKTVQLPGSIAGSIADGGMKTLEMWAGSSNSDYSFYDVTSIKIKCEKPT